MPRCHIHETQPNYSFRFAHCCFFNLTDMLYLCWRTFAMSLVAFWSGLALSSLLAMMNYLLLALHGGDNPSVGLAGHANLYTNWSCKFVHLQLVMQFLHLQICKTCVSSLSFSVIGPHRQSIYKHKSSSQCHRHQVPAKETTFSCTLWRQWAETGSCQMCRC